LGVLGEREVPRDLAIGEVVTKIHQMIMVVMKLGYTEKTERLSLVNETVLRFET
jgi:hypothetical protein